MTDGEYAALLKLAKAQAELIDERNSSGWYHYRRSFEKQDRAYLADLISLLDERRPPERR